MLWVGKGVDVERHENPCSLQFVQHVIQYVERLPAGVHRSTDVVAGDLPRWRSYYRRAERQANRIEVVLDEEVDILINGMPPQLVNAAIGLEPCLPVAVAVGQLMLSASGGRCANWRALHPIRPFDMKLMLKAILVCGDPQPLTVSAHIKRDRERLAHDHAPRHAHACQARPRSIGSIAKLHRGKDAA